VGEVIIGTTGRRPAHKVGGPRADEYRKKDAFHCSGGGEHHTNWARLYADKSIGPASRISKKEGEK